MAPLWMLQGYWKGEEDMTTAIELHERREVTPMELIQIATSQGADVDKLMKLMELQERWEANQARKAYNEAFSGFKAESVRIERNITVTDGPLRGKKYADLYSVVSAITPLLSKHGLHSSWKLTKDEPAWIEVTCTLRHELGHSESVSMGGPPDTGGAKNLIQARASTVAYLERYTLLAATGMAAAGTDNDGTGPKVPEDKLVERLEWIKASRNEEELKKQYTAALEWAQKAGDKKAEKSIIDAKNDTWKVIHARN